jgi:RNA recognition motif-containing protein
MNICVGNLSRDVTGSDLREVFESFGRVETADVAKHRHGDGSRGFGYVGMPARSEAVCAVLGVHGRSLNGQRITATEVRLRDPVSGACRTRCHCRSERHPAGDTHPIPAAFRSEERSDGTGKNGLQ